MINERIIDNQRRMALMVIDGLAPRLTPGRPFMIDLRYELGKHPGFGSHDRRLYRDFVFTWLRFRAWFDRARAIDETRALDLLVLLGPDSKEMVPLQSAIGCPGGIAMKAPQEITARLAELVPAEAFEVTQLLPQWFRSHCPELYEAERETWLQTQRTPFWLRAQRGSGSELVQALARESVEAFASNVVPGAVRVGDYVDIERHPLVAEGRAEIQDAGSQALLLMAAPRKNENWLDLCAGAGGKTIQLAAILGPKGSVVAHDVRREALIETRRRMNRAGLKNVRIEPVLPDAGRTFFDGVLVDAPCSASGTWRRHPFLRHQLTGIVINRHVKDQKRLLSRGAERVRPGGRLIYTTCSLSRRENDDVVTAFLTENRDYSLERPEFVPEGVTPGAAGWVTLLPSQLDSDGYFLACMRREPKP